MADGYEKTTFLNVDLDIWSASDLQPLVDGFGARVYLLHAAREKRTYWVLLELSGQPKSADSCIRRFCALIRALPRAQRTLWNKAKRRDFNIGIAAAHEPSLSEFALSEETVKAAAALGARIVLTVYAADRGP